MNLHILGYIIAGSGVYFGSLYAAYNHGWIRALEWTLSEMDKAGL